MEQKKFFKDDSETQHDVVVKNNNNNNVRFEDEVFEKEENTLNDKVENEQLANNKESSIYTVEMNGQIEVPNERFEKTTKFVREFSSPFEYSYYVIASPSLNRKVTNLSTRSSSFASMSSCDTTSCSTPIIKLRKSQASSSKASLEAMKRKLWDEICKIDVRIAAMEAEKLILINLRNALLRIRNLVFQSDRNKQGVPTPEKMRSVMKTLVEEIQSENEALHTEIIIPFLHDIAREISGLKNISTLISQNKTNLKLNEVEEFLAITGIIFGMVETILLIYYEEDSEENVDITNGNSTSADTSEPIADEEQTDTNNSNKEENSNQDGYEDSLEKDSFSAETDTCIQNSLKITLKGLVKKIAKAKKYFNTIERLSSGNPKIKSLTNCFREINLIFKEEKICENGIETYLDELNENFTEFFQALLSERPGEKELEQVKMLLGELSGRIKVLLKSDVLNDSL